MDGLELRFRGRVGFRGRVELRGRDGFRGKDGFRGRDGVRGRIRIGLGVKIELTVIIVGAVLHEKKILKYVLIYVRPAPTPQPDRSIKHILKTEDRHGL